MHHRLATAHEREGAADEATPAVVEHDDDSRDLGAPTRSARVRLGVGAVVVLLVTALVVAVVVSALSQSGSSSRLPVATSRPSTGPSAASAAAPRLLVHVLGAVRTPGLVVLGAGARVVDAVSAAGGLTDDADPGGVNLARTVEDGEQLYVPRVGEQPSGGSPPGAASEASGRSAPGGAGGGGKVDLNRATVGDLETLPRIGPALAQRIVDWREANGRFASVSDLQKVTGIGDKIFAGLKDLVTV